MNASKVLILLHGRGGSPEDMISLTKYLNVKDYWILAPQATNHTWYPQSFLAAVEENEPWLSSALALIGKTVDKAISKGISQKDIYFLGFSQGACLTTEYIARNAKKYGGVVAFTGGLIGEEINLTNYNGQFEETPIFLGTSNPDFHVPVERVHDTTKILTEMGAVVTEKVYEGMGHTISQDEIDMVNKLIFK
ncbi:MAG: phospholipase [Pseudopedobacter saltans]|uniref:Phospholipase n=1 Tax=Pseudopedobacter saltans TaxID=151895 RepID=A0A2W5F4H4_9SPHI|nr:MAG: phospholipase [Pseudopedobacter saltans]